MMRPASPGSAPPGIRGRLFPHCRGIERAPAKLAGLERLECRLNRGASGSLQVAEQLKDGGLDARADVEDARPGSVDGIDKRLCHVADLDVVARLGSVAKNGGRLGDLQKL